MDWDEEYSDGYFPDGDDEMVLLQTEAEEESYTDGLEDELDYELYEEEKAEADPDDFPDSFEEWKLMKEHEQWELEQDNMDRMDEAMEFEE